VYRSIPTFAEQGYPEVRGDTWFWLAGPRNLPPAIITRLSAEVRRIIKLQRTQAYMNQMALMTRDVDPTAVTAFVRDELAYWAPLAKEVGLSVQ
jgi:tripartite-type tricarboxylate transporter receptor subunit TctC